MTSPLLAGFLLGLSLILPIGAQNAFVLRVGLRGEHVWAVCLACALSDALLILAGVSGFSHISATLPWAEDVLRYFGAAFLIVYGARSFRDAFRTEALKPSEAAPESLKRVVLTCLAFTWLNPHVYLDTVVLIGSISTQFSESRGLFALGAMLASFTFFFSLGYGARLLKPLFARPVTWRILDVAIGLIMWVTAARLLLNET
ncbi:LysE/ArgO family amino acid transporter [Microvirga guangxiensis]|uniref:L-lysine exporter family protein LysE/ArgO n=1 Tax=Microvirga guangxiensis TaxID=549386 RepID=A0A1G5BW71_9HYPH|nr:LysE/ArgO family amino acid transporter [Microvirga guangxiensis]SCX94411.1 L-lysine exporter family protein LysE/ArgO [Microvirga guangxiensis]